MVTMSAERLQLEKEAFERRFKLFTNWNRGRNYITVLNAISMIKKYSIGKRKDGMPEISHPIDVALSLTAFDEIFESYLSPIILAGAVCHDGVEDHSIPEEEIVNKCGEEVYNVVMILSKKYVLDGALVTKPMTVYMNQIGNNRAASIIKLADRVANNQTIKDVFSIAKLEEYNAETRNSIIPMSKIAIDEFPEYERIYEHFRWILRSQLNFVDEIIAIRKLSSQ